MNEKFLRNTVGPRLTQLLQLFREAMMGTDVKSMIREFLEPYLPGLSESIKTAVSALTRALLRLLRQFLGLTVQS